MERRRVRHLLQYRALAEDPGNVLLQELLIETYRDELDVMKRVDAISNNAMVRGDI